MIYRVDFGPHFKFDLAEAIDWYDGRQAGLGEQFLGEIEACLERIRKNPLSFVVVHADLRRALVRRFPYALFFRLSAELITVIGCFHGRRHPISWESR